MFNRIAFGFMLTFLALFSSASVQLSSSINDVYHRGSSELAGSLSLEIMEDEFANASRESPIFINVIFDNNVTTSQTLVDLTSSDETLNQPIDLGLYLYNAGDDITLQASRDAVQIVRWVAGESGIWLRIQESSSHWILSGETSGPPTQTNSVDFDFGARGYYIDTPENHRNLPFNLRSGVDETTVDYGTDTLFCLDFSDSNLASDGSNDSIMYHDIIAYDSSAEVSPGIYSAGTQTGINFTGGFLLARGKGWSIDHEVLSQHPAAVARPLPQSGAMQLGTQLNFRLQSKSGNILNTEISQGSKVILSIDEETPVGFVEGGSLFTLENPGAVTYSNPFTLGETTVYRQVELIWEGGNANLENYLLNLSTQLLYDNTMPNAVNLNYDIQLPRYRQDRDICSHVLYSLASGSIHLMTATSGRVIPHITMANGNFNSKLLVANSGSEETSYTIAFYDVAGTVIDSVEGTLEGDSTQILSTEDHVDAAYARVAEGSDVKVSVTYQAKGGGKSPAQVGDSNVTATRWRLYAGSPELTYDAIALVNTGSAVAYLELKQVNMTDGSSVTVNLEVGIAPNGKTTQVLNEIFTAMEDSYYEVSSNQPLALVALRGDWASQYLWSNPATAME